MGHETSVQHTRRVQHIRKMTTEIAALRNLTLVTSRIFSQFSKKELKSMRKKLAFLCHSDRGGDPELCARMNMLFDMLLA
jgi:hypothetical protein